MRKTMVTVDQLVNSAFWRRVVKSIDGCWRWVGPKHKAGYGKVMICVSAHRLSYMIAHGSIPDGLVIDHLCDNPDCVNPDHLKPTTNWHNIMRAHGLAAANAKKEACPSGHLYNKKNTGFTGRRRYCKSCKRIKALARYYRIRASA